MGDIAAWLQSWWNSLTPGTRDNIIAGLIVAFVIGLIAFLRTLFVAIGRRIFKKPADTAREEAPNQRNLREMRKIVRGYWVESVFKESLYNEALIPLNMAKRADSVDNHSWNLMVQQPGEANQMLAPGTRILDVFDRMQQRLLILGEQGSGKTTTMLELARDLLDRADRDPTEHTPVVFNLSSWAERRPPLADWLVDELRTRYSIPKDVARAWVKNDELLLLLDGLDEVQEQGRDACVQAINAFRQEHIVPLVVCSRTAEYERLSGQLKLGGAVVLQPLATEQIEDYFTRAGESLSALRAAIRQDEALQEMAKSPLLLSIMTLAYQGASPGEVSKLEATQTRRLHLFDTYIARMFHRREVKLRFTPLETLGWLRWLAARLVQFGQTTLLIERMQPGWLQPAKARPWGAYALTALWGPVYGLIGGLILGFSIFSIGPVVGLSFELSRVLMGGLIVGLIVGLIFGLIDGFSRELGNIKTDNSSAQFRIRLKSGLYSFMLYGISCGLPVGLIFVLLSGRLLDVLLSTLLGGLLVGLSGGLMGVYRPIALMQVSSRSRQTHSRSPSSMD